MLTNGFAPRKGSAFCPFRLLLAQGSTPRESMLLVAQICSSLRRPRQGSGRTSPSPRGGLGRGSRWGSAPLRSVGETSRRDPGVTLMIAWEFSNRGTPSSLPLLHQPSDWLRPGGRCVVGGCVSCLSWTCEPLKQQFPLLDHVGYGLAPVTLTLSAPRSGVGSRSSCVGRRRTRQRLRGGGRGLYSSVEIGAGRRRAELYTGGARGRSAPGSESLCLAEVGRRGQGGGPASSTGRVIAGHRAAGELRESAFIAMVTAQMKHWHWVQSPGTATDHRSNEIAVVVVPGVDDHSLHGEHAPRSSRPRATPSGTFCWSSRLAQEDSPGRGDGHAPSLLRLPHPRPWARPRSALTSTTRAEASADPRAAGGHTDAFARGVRRRRARARRHGDVASS
ncbi:unnamed protein product [Boreogadus saida]